MARNYFFKNIQILEGPRSTLKKEHVLINNGVIKAFGEKALLNAELLGIKPQKAKNLQNYYIVKNILLNLDLKKVISFVLTIVE